MSYLRHLFVAALGVTVLLSNATAQDVFLYPNKGQSAQQTDQDKYACYQWASQQSGHDPMAAAGTGAAPSPAIPARVPPSARRPGGLFGGMRQREANAQQHQQAQRQAAATAGRADTYNRAFAACLEGRGYTVR